MQQPSSTNEKKYSEWRELPMTLNPQDIQSILGIGRRQVYELLNQDPKPFHHVRVGRLIKIPRDNFLEWFLGHAAKNNMSKVK